MSLSHSTFLEGRKNNSTVGEMACGTGSNKCEQKQPIGFEKGNALKV
jgi:hypothetical protein